MKTVIAVLCSGILLAGAGLAAAEPVASVVAVRGRATVERGGRKLDAQPKLAVELQDTVVTAEGGRAKILFIDDSVLTLAEKSRMSVDAFIHSRSDRGKSLFNLLDGKMRAVVGKTRFEVKTPTVVAAARGTVILFDVGSRNGSPFTRITCLEGIVDVHALTSAPGTPPVLLSPGHSMVVEAGQAMPQPTQLSPSELENLKRDTSTSGSEIKPPEPPRPPLPPPPPPVVPQISQQPPKQPSRVDIGVKF